MDRDSVLNETKKWIQTFVIGLNICPFAKRVVQEGKVRYVVSFDRDEESILALLETELKLLNETPMEQIETSILILPEALANFLDYNDFLDLGDELIEKLDLSGVIQIASFHPNYQFADTQHDSVENYTNRSPYPMLHLLREDSISNLNLSEEDLELIPRKNIQTMASLGRAKVLQMLEEIKTESER